MLWKWSIGRVGWKYSKCMKTWSLTSTWSYCLWSLGHIMKVVYTLYQPLLIVYSKHRLDEMYFITTEWNFTPVHVRTCRASAMRCLFGWLTLLALPSLIYRNFALQIHSQGDAVQYISQITLQTSWITNMADENGVWKEGAVEVPTFLAQKIACSRLCGHLKMAVLGRISELNCVVLTGKSTELFCQKIASNRAILLEYGLVIAMWWGPFQIFVKIDS